MYQGTGWFCWSAKCLKPPQTTTPQNFSLTFLTRYFVVQICQYFWNERSLETSNFATWVFLKYPALVLVGSSLVIFWLADLGGGSHPSHQSHIAAADRVRSGQAATGPTPPGLHQQPPGCPSSITPAPVVSVRRSDRENGRWRGDAEEKIPPVDLLSQIKAQHFEMQHDLSSV